MRILPLLLLTACSASQQPAADPETRLLKKTDLLSHYRLGNGLELLLVPNPAVPLATVEIAVRTGSFTETPKTSGLAHLYEHMFFKGNAAYPTQAEYDKRESELGISSNGTTSTEVVRYFITLPTRNLEAGVEFMAHALLTMKIDPEELARERPVVLNEYDRNESDPGFYLRRSIRERIFAAFYYRKNPIGERDAVGKATAELLQDFRRRYYVPNNSALIVQGDFDPAHALAFAKHYFGPQKWPAGPDPHAAPPAPHPRLKTSQTVVVNRDFAQALIQIGQHGPDVGADPQQTRDTYAGDCLGILLSLPQSKFQRALVDSGLCASASWSYYTQHDGGELDAGAICAPEKAAEAVRAILAELEKLDDPGYLTEEDLKAAQRQIEVTQTFSRESGQDFANELAFWWAVAGLDYYLDYVPNIKKLTLEDLRRFASTWIVDRPRVTGVLISAANQKKVGLTEEALGGAAASTAGSGGPALRTLPNGLRLLHKPVKTNDVVALQLFIDGGSRVLDAKSSGIESLTLGAMLKGTKRFSKDEFESTLSGLGAQVDSSAGLDYSSLSLKCLKGDFARALELFADAVAQPLLSDEEVKLLREQMQTGLAAADSQAQPKMIRTCNDLFYAGHPYAYVPEGTLETVGGLTREAAVTHHGRLLNAARMLVVVVGDVDAGLVERAFGSLPRADFAAKAPPPVPVREGIDLTWVEREIPTAWALGKFPAPPLADPDYPALRVGIEVLSDRLFKKVRSEAGISYAVASGLGESMANAGYLYVTSPKPNEAIALMYGEVKRAQEEPLDPHEVRSAALKLYTRHFMRNEPNEGQAASLGRGLLAGAGPDTYDRIMERVTKVTAAEAQAALKKYVGRYRFGIVAPAGSIDASVFKRP